MSVIRAIAIFLCGFLALTPSMAQIIKFGPCPDIQAMQDFNPSRYLGRWYEIEKYFFLFEFAGKCTTADYTLKENGVIGVVNRQTSEITHTQTGIQGEAKLVGRSDEGKLEVRFPSLPINISAPYWVIETDYDNYSLVWSCFEVGFFHARNAWILTRQQNPPREIISKAYRAAEKNSIPLENFMDTIQTDCPKNPMPSKKNI